MSDGNGESELDELRKQVIFNEFLLNAVNRQVQRLMGHHGEGKEVLRQDFEAAAKDINAKYPDADFELKGFTEEGPEWASDV